MAVTDPAPTPERPAPPYYVPGPAYGPPASPFVPTGQVTWHPPRKQLGTGLIIVCAVGALFAMLVLAGGLYELRLYNALPGVCRQAVVKEAQSRLATARNASTSVPVTVNMTDIQVSDPIYDGPFKATVPAKMSAQVSASIFTRDTSVPLQCNASFLGTWHVTVTNAV